jgi:ankyrin
MLGSVEKQYLKLTYVLSFTAALDVLSKLHLPTAPPPLNEGESLVSRILQLGPPGTKFLG